MKPHVTVIMAVHNGEQYLRLAVHSILQQTYKNIRLVVVNDGSTDSSGDILNQIAKRDSRLLLLNQQNKGLTKSLIRAMAETDDELVARMDADDISILDRIEKQVSHMSTHERCGLVGSDATLIDSSGTALKHVTVPSGNRIIRSQLRKGNVFVHGSVLMRRSIYTKCGGYDPRFNYSQDFDLWLRMSRFSEVRNVPERLYLLRQHSNSISIKNQDSQLEFAARAIILDRAYRELPPRSEARNLTDPPVNIPDSERHEIYAELATRRGMYDHAIRHYSKINSFKSSAMLIILKNIHITNLAKAIYSRVRNLVLYIK